jgi:hypothetical protein
MAFERAANRVSSLLRRFTDFGPDGAGAGNRGRKIDRTLLSNAKATVVAPVGCLRGLAWTCKPASCDGSSAARGEGIVSSHSLIS